MRNSKLIKILIVEDDTVDVMIVKRAFKEAEIPHSAIEAKDGQEALSILNKNKDLKSMVILLDMNLPKMDGWEFLKNIKTNLKLKSIPIYILTSSHEDELLLKNTDLNVDGFIQFNNLVKEAKSIVTNMENNRNKTQRRPEHEQTTSNFAG